eukprot:scaffold174098_cov31-Tisochrysis_lutea.AAC.1
MAGVTAVTHGKIARGSIALGDGGMVVTMAMHLSIAAKHALRWSGNVGRGNLTSAPRKVRESSCDLGGHHLRRIHLLGESCLGKFEAAHQIGKDTLELVYAEIVIVERCLPSRFTGQGEDSGRSGTDSQQSQSKSSGIPGRQSGQGGALELKKLLRVPLFVLTPRVYARRPANSQGKPPAPIRRFQSTDPTGAGSSSVGTAAPGALMCCACIASSAVYCPLVQR